MQELAPAYMPAPEDEFWDVDYLSYTFIGPGGVPPAPPARPVVAVPTFTG